MTVEGRIHFVIVYKQIIRRFLRYFGQKYFKIRPSRRIGDLLLAGSFISKKQLDRALEISRRTSKKLGEVLVEERFVAPETLATVLSFQLNVPVIDLKQFKIDREALKLIPRHVAWGYKVLPLAVDGDTLRVATEEPQDTRLIDMLANLTRKKIRPVLPLSGSLKDAINANYNSPSRHQEKTIDARK